MPNESDVFRSELTGRIPTENSYTSLTSMDYEVTPACNPPEVKSNEFQYHNYDLTTRPQGVPLVPPDLSRTSQQVAHNRRPSPPLSHRGATPCTEEVQSTVVESSSGARPKSNQGRKKQHSMKRTYSCENASSMSSSSSSSSSSSQNSNTWPGGKISLRNGDCNPHNHQETSPQRAPLQIQQERIPGDYSGQFGHLYSHPSQQHQRTESMWSPKDTLQNPHSRQVLRDPVDNVSRGLSSSPVQCESGMLFNKFAIYPLKQYDNFCL